MTRPVRVVIADDHPMFRYGLTAAVAAAAEVEVSFVDVAEVSEVPLALLTDEGESARLATRVAEVVADTVTPSVTVGLMVPEAPAEVCFRAERTVARS